MDEFWCYVTIEWPLKERLDLTSCSPLAQPFSTHYALSLLNSCPDNNP